MDITVPAGRYIVAVSGGVDSIALLHLLQALPDVKLTVAHFDHGIRHDSSEDRRLVQQRAREYRLPFVYTEGHLGAGTNEATARAARYKFLRDVQAASGASALITAHHQDDVLETAIINLLRGTGRKGLTALRNRRDLLRPLLTKPKREVIDFAKSNNLTWREDSTNQDLNYLRNYVRHKIIPRFDEQTRSQLAQVISDLSFTNEELDRLLVSQLHMQSQAGTLEREYFSQLPHSVSMEVMAAWLRAHEVENFDGRTLDRLVIAAKTGANGRRFDVMNGVTMVLDNGLLALVRPER